MNEIPASRKGEITAQERAMLLDTWSGPRPNPSLLRDDCLHELFESAADQRPDHPAVICNDVTLTYKELELRANRLAHALRVRGIGNEDRVALLMPRSEDVYVAMLAIMKAGAAYVPLDPDIPLERARFILDDCGAKALITRSTVADALGAEIPTIHLSRDKDELAAFPTTRLARTVIGTRRDNLCYMIYTSGTTGKAKGVQIEHRQATHLVRAESQLYNIQPDDRIFQFASVAFDASVEEIWMAFFHGATLVVGTPAIIHAGSEFSAILTRLQVTVLSCVPTFLSMVDGDIPTIRLLIVGGETCPSELVTRWLKPGRQMFNTYGPTETTVIATAAAMATHQPVTIGHAIANMKVYLLDDYQRLVPPGEPGELCIGGEGVARGYLNRPELQKEKFITVDTLTETPIRLYRSGDQARFRSDGELEYLGRLDDQIKLRGFRIELAEIESALAQCHGVLAAAATVHLLTQRIAAFFVPQPGTTVDRTALRRALVDRLPSYMVPAFLDEVQLLPMTSSGKIDRRRLPEPRAPLREEKGARILPKTDDERAIMSVWSAVFNRDDLSTQDDFFLDLDGHSLLAANAVSQLRRKTGFEQLSVADVYSHPTVEKLARLAQAVPIKPIAPAPPFHHTSRATYVACVIGQAFGIFVLAGIYAWQWLGAFLAYGYLAVADWPIPRALLGALGVYVVMTPAILALSIALKWLLLGRIRPGRYPLWGWYYWRFWFVRSVVRAAPVPYLAGTPYLNLYYRLMGARIGKDVFIGSAGLCTFDVLTVGDGCSIGTDTTLDGASVEGGMLKISPITIGKNCWVGNRSSLGSNVILEDNSGLEDLSMIGEGVKIPAGECWRGSPAQAVGKMDTVIARHPWTLDSSVKQMLGILAFPLVTLAGIFPGLMVIVHFGHQDPGYFFLVASPLVAISFVVFLCIEVWVFKWLLLGQIREGCYPVGESYYVRLWFFDQLMDLSLEVIGTFYTTLYLRPWLTALGAKIGRRSEISTIRLIHPDLLTTGPECFLADDVMVGTPRVRAGWMTIGRARLGERVFVGNGAVLPAEVRLGSNVLIGALSIAPLGELEPVPDGTSWFGSPPIYLPSRQKQEAFVEGLTYRPARKQVALRLIIEFIRIILPSTLFVILASLIVNVTDVMQDHVGLRIWLLTLPVLYVIAGLLSIIASWLLKATVVGRYREDQKPLWSSFVWRTELVTGVYENLCVLFFLNLLRGTPFISSVLRLFGMQIGKRCYIDTTWFTEFDLVSVGDHAALNEDANIQTHLFEDRVMKMGRIDIGARCSVGAMSTILYSTTLGDESALGELSLLMKGEVLPANTRWHGIPARKGV